jgi:hypothetical protein
MKTTLATQTADNAQAQVSIAANSGESIYITSLSCSFDGTVSGMSLEIVSGGSTLWHVDVPDANIKQFDWTHPLKIPVGQDADVNLSASGTGGTSGTLNVAYGKGE